MKQVILMLALTSLAIGGCRKKPDPVKPVITTEPTQVNLAFEHMVGDEQLVLNDKTYTNANGDPFTVSFYAYYISNIALIKDDGTEFKEEYSYHLVNEDKSASKKMALKGLPSGRYTQIRFMIGVDSARNVSGAQTGDLDLSTAMYWDWNSGYIMAKLEGKSVTSSSQFLTFHLGGYSGQYSVLKWVTLTLPQAITVAEGKSPTIHLHSDVAEWFKTPTTINFNYTSILMSHGAAAREIADNYADMFSIDHID